MNYDHSDRSHTSQSMLKQLDVSAARFKGLFVDDPPTIADKDTKDKKLGRALHGYTLLPPEQFEETFPVMPRWELDEGNVTKEKVPRRTYSKTTEYCKTKKAEFLEVHGGKDIIDESVLRKVKNMKSAILAHDDARVILDAADAFEVPHFWENKIKRRCCMDIVCPTLSLVADIKKIPGVPSTAAFAREAAKWRWWVQAPWYLQAAEDKYGPGVITRFVFILVNGEPPHQVALHQFDDERPTWALGNDSEVESDLAWAKRRTEELVDELVRRRETDDWTDSWAKGINKVPMPRWLRSKFYDTEEIEPEAEDEAA